LFLDNLKGQSGYPTSFLRRSTNIGRLPF